MKKCIYVLFLCNFIFTEEINVRDYYYPIDKILNEPVVYVSNVISEDYVTNEISWEGKLYTKFSAHLENYNKEIQQYDTVLTADYYSEDFDHIFQWVDIVKSDGTLILGDSKFSTILEQTPRPMIFNDSSICYSLQYKKDVEDTVLFKITYRPVSKYANKFNQDVLSLMFESVDKYEYWESHDNEVFIIYFGKNMGEVYAKGFFSHIRDMNMIPKSYQDVVVESWYNAFRRQLWRVIPLGEFEYLMSLKKP